MKYTLLLRLRLRLRWRIRWSHLIRRTRSDVRNIRRMRNLTALRIGNHNASVIEQAARLAAEAAQPKSDVRGSAEFKRHVVYTFVTRALSNQQARAA